MTKPFFFRSVSSEGLKQLFRGAGGAAGLSAAVAEFRKIGADGFDLRRDIQPRGQLGSHHFACGALLQQFGKQFFFHDQVGQADPLDLDQQAADQRGKRRDPVADHGGDARQRRLQRRRA